MATRGARLGSRATVWDHVIYEQHPGSDRLAIDRDDCTAILRALCNVDRWHPWRTVMERRLTP